MNFANADMVGHTGNYEAAVQGDGSPRSVPGPGRRRRSEARATTCSSPPTTATPKRCATSNGKIHTQHTLNPVPAIWVAPNTAIAPKSARVALKDGTLADVMPTLCAMMKLPIPSEVTGKNLLPC